MYSTIGYMPSYLRKKKCNTSQVFSSKISKFTSKEDNLNENLKKES